MRVSKLKIYDTGEGKKKVFVPLEAPRVRMYCCGPTVYDFLHIGNFRGAVFFNFLRNWLEFSGYKVDYIYNFTDIDDKILNRAAKEKVPPREISEKYIKEFKKDYEDLKLKPQTKNPKATETVSEIIDLIKKLIQEGKAYESNGDVFFSVKSFPDYGYLSGQKTEELLAGARVETDPNKKDPLDFNLWKKSKPEENWSWKSPWGEGRPGWHIECTAMIHKFLGQEIDIHGGGSDLIFPHHENEIAQSEASCGKKYVRYWMHNNMIVTKGDKMSKSLGNMMSMREFLKNYPGEVFKYLILSSHYRSPLQFSEKTIQQAVASLAGIYSCMAKASRFLSLYEGKETLRRDFQKTLSQAEKEIEEAFDDDFATPKAFAVLFSVLKIFKNILEESKLPEEKAGCAEKFLLFFEKYGEILSLFQEPAEEFLKNMDDRLLSYKGLNRKEIEDQIRKRKLARQEKNFKLSDQIRWDLEKMGIEVRDITKEDTVWEVRKTFYAGGIKSSVK